MALLLKTTSCNSSKDSHSKNRIPTKEDLLQRKRFSKSFDRRGSIRKKHHIGIRDMVKKNRDLMKNVNEILRNRNFEELKASKSLNDYYV